jgi:hypothetical protein
MWRRMRWGEVRRDEMRWEIIQNFGRKAHLVDLGVNKKIILKWMLWMRGNKLAQKGSLDGLFWIMERIFVFHKRVNCLEYLNEYELFKTPCEDWATWHSERNKLNYVTLLLICRSDYCVMTAQYKQTLISTIFCIAPFLVALCVLSFSCSIRAV